MRAACAGPKEALNLSAHHKEDRRLGWSLASSLDRGTCASHFPQRTEPSLLSTHCAQVPVRRSLSSQSGGVWMWRWLPAGHDGCHHSLAAGKCVSFSLAKLPGLLGKLVRPHTRHQLWSSETLGWGPGCSGPAWGSHSWSGTSITGLLPKTSMFPAGSDGFALSLIHLGSGFFLPL